MSRSRARKNRFKYKTLRRIGFFKIFVMDYPNSNGRVYSSLNFGSTKFSKEVIRELPHPQGSFFSISAHVSEGYFNSWEEGPIRAPTTEPQDTSAMEWQLGAMCGLLGVDKENLVINQPVLFASSVEKSVSTAIKNLHEIKRERFRGPDISKLSEAKADETPPCPWPTKLDLSGVWSNPVDVTPIPGHSFEEVKTEKLLNLARALKKSNAREYLKKTAEILGEDIEVDDIFLGESIKMIRQRTDTWGMNEVKEDSPEWAIAMVAFCRYPEIAEQLKTEGLTLTEVQRSTLDEEKLVTTSDIYYLFNTERDTGLEAFKPVSFHESYWYSRDQKPLNILKINES